jgi:TolB protein
MNADGTGQINLTNSPENDAEPDWSPYSHKIVFARSEGAQWDIYAMNTDGTGVTQLTSGSVFDLDPAWSPDGTKIAFARGGATPSIYLMDADGTDQVQPTQQRFSIGVR